MPSVGENYKSEYRIYKFNTNIVRMMIVGWVLTLEQFLLGLLLAESGSVLRSTYFISSGFMLCFAVVSLIFIERKPKKIAVGHEIYEMSFAFFGMLVALGRYFSGESTVLNVPTIYIAVLYGIAVIFVFSRRQILFLYSLVTVSAVVFLPHFHPEISATSYQSDIITNGIIASVVLSLNTRRFIASFNDKKHIELINSELREQSIRDGLTGLYNRRKLDDVLAEVILKSNRYGTDFSLILIDLDHFKRINDSFGHHTGDSALVEFSRILEDNIREVDVCGRWGGEEFLVICQETALADAALLAERLRRQTESKELKNGFSITASLGVVSWSECSEDSALFRKADERLYIAKKQGRNKVVSED